MDYKLNQKLPFDVCKPQLVQGHRLRTTENAKNCDPFPLIEICKNAFSISEITAMQFLRNRLRIVGMISIRFGPVDKQLFNDGEAAECELALNTGLNSWYCFP
ncbi:hypothetical protein TNIN_283641 [Trichonephila inaurata madagascariensis]|uniref:Uncharacterized protein n=1 Tax=Trichonephila inaurata madagascariensis TaxID=2747483 RepID=A0A8X6XFL7_9ARAC|nr:hypothetical protein TNIN_283641 [Trichonephila inaurata madagascariensis]